MFAIRASIILKRATDILQALPVEFGPIGNTTVQRTNVDEVKIVLWVYPFTTAVVDFEGEVGRLGVRLNGREISAYDGRVWICLCKVTTKNEPMPCLSYDIAYIAHMPVPVPISMALLGFLIGAK